MGYNIYMLKVEIPDTCPQCGSPIVRINEQLFCKNPDCFGVIFKRIENFAKVLKIKGLGSKTIEKLGIESIEDIYRLNREDIVVGIGEKLADKLLKEIDASKTVSFADFITAFSIPLISSGTASKLAKVVSSFGEINRESCKKAGVGDKATANLLNWLENTWPNLELPIIVIFQEPLKQKLTVCISGKLTSFATKAEAEKWLLENNVEVVSSMSKKVEYLIKEDDKHSSKYDYAIKNDVPIVTIEELKEIL